MAIEHVNISDSERHEPKGASTATTDTVLHSDGDGTTTWKFVSYNDLSDKPTLSTFYTPMALQADSTASDVAGIVSDFNDLLAALISAGLMESS